MSVYKVTWYAGPYDGARVVDADDADHALAKVRAWVHKTMTLPMYAEGYGVECCYDVEEQS
jgi:hypothetical protein